MLSSLNRCPVWEPDSSVSRESLVQTGSVGMTSPETDTRTHCPEFVSNKQRVS